MDGPERADFSPTNAIVPVDFEVLEPPVPYFLISHPPPQGGLPASLLTHALSIQFPWSIN